MGADWQQQKRGFRNALPFKRHTEKKGFTTELTPDRTTMNNLFNFKSWFSNSDKLPEQQHYILQTSDQDCYEDWGWASRGWDMY